jgi:uridine kinase
MRIKSAKRVSSKTSVTYALDLIDTNLRKIFISFVYNRTEKKYRASRVIVNGKNHGSKLRPLLNQNEMYNIQVEQFMEKLKVEVDIKIKDKKEKNSSLQSLQPVLQ